MLDLKNLNLAQALAAQQGQSVGIKAQSLVQALGGASSSAAQLLTGLGSGTPAGEGGAAKFDSRSGARVDKVLKRSDTDEEIERLEKRKKLIALTKELRGEEQSMALERQGMPSSASGTKSATLPTGLTIAGGTAAAPADKCDTMKAARVLPANLFTGPPAEQKTLLQAAAGSRGSGSEAATTPEKAVQSDQLSQAALHEEQEIARLKRELAENQARMEGIEAKSAALAAEQEKIAAHRHREQEEALAEAAHRLREQEEEAKLAKRRGEEEAEAERKLQEARARAEAARRQAGWLRISSGQSTEVKAEAEQRDEDWDAEHKEKQQSQLTEELQHQVRRLNNEMTALWAQSHRSKEMQEEQQIAEAYRYREHKEEQAHRYREQEEMQAHRYREQEEQRAQLASELAAL